MFILTILDILLLLLSTMITSLNSIIFCLIIFRYIVGSIKLIKIFVYIFYRCLIKKIFGPCLKWDGCINGINSGPTKTIRMRLELRQTCMRGIICKLILRLVVSLCIFFYDCWSLVFMNNYFVDKLFICFSFLFKVVSKRKKTFCLKLLMDLSGFISGTSGNWKLVNIYFIFFIKLT
jgi:hypothetical protein